MCVNVKSLCIGNDGHYNYRRGHIYDITMCWQKLYTSGSSSGIKENDSKTRTFPESKMMTYGSHPVVTLSLVPNVLIIRHRFRAIHRCTDQGPIVVKLPLHTRRNGGSPPSNSASFVRYSINRLCAQVKLALRNNDILLWETLNRIYDRRLIPFPLVIDQLDKPIPDEMGYKLCCFFFTRGGRKLAEPFDSPDSEDFNELIQKATTAYKC